MRRGGYKTAPRQPKKWMMCQASPGNMQGSPFLRLCLWVRLFVRTRVGAHVCMWAFSDQDELGVEFVQAARNRLALCGVAPQLSQARSDWRACQTAAFAEVWGMTETNPLGSIARRVSKIKDLEKSAGLRDLFAISQARTPCLRCGRVLHERDKGGPAMPRTRTLPG